MLRAFPHILLFKCVPNFGEGQRTRRARTQVRLRVHNPNLQRQGSEVV
jgi:hypothetical protein